MTKEEKLLTRILKMYESFAEMIQSIPEELKGTEFAEMLETKKYALECAYSDMYYGKISLVKACKVLWEEFSYEPLDIIDGGCDE